MAKWPLSQGEVFSGSIEDILGENPSWPFHLMEYKYNKVLHIEADLNIWNPKHNNPLCSLIVNCMQS